ncbi:hypothetical protein EDF46_0890 [Frondihabitans sp. PhB188]|uniref:hypothetical protein n=1 Tax=Frondihabitans sp. PhB188 TaxID=2485200 RepID=UPI000F489DAC|nr:hypothetical protein [Frondihabitans sp. PhB188]ROQ41510.1 hypothetical protein EDF46_0890 [Frondihabitans sp. PhB188]
MLVLACVVVALVIAVMIRRWWAMSRAPKPARQEAPTAGAGVPAPGAEVVLGAPNATDVAGADAAWSEARRLRAALLDQEVPPTISAWEIVPEAGEVFFYDLKAVHERFYGQDAGYQPTGSFLLGSPAFILAGLVVTGAVNASRQRAAQALAATQWRDREGIRVLVTNHRLLCLVRGQWLSFHYGAMTAVYPEVAERTLVCGFESIPPLRLSGIDAPILAVMTLFMTHGADALAQHPALRPLD